MTQEMIIALPHFQGSLLELQNLLKKEELSILEISISHITSVALLEKDETLFFSQGPDLIYLSSLFLLWKTRKLLPKEERVTHSDTEGLADPFIEQGEFKQIVEGLWMLEQKRLPFFSRDVLFIPEKQDSHFAEVQWEELAELFQKLMEKAPIEEVDITEEYNLSSRLTFLEEELAKHKKIAFAELFSPHKSKGELIALFLALLELIKMQKIYVFRKEEDEGSESSLMIGYK